MKKGDIKWKYPGLARTLWEPINPVPGPDDGNTYTYIRKAKRIDKYCICLCEERYNWFMTTLVKAGLNVSCLAPGSIMVPKEMCLKISEVLRKAKCDDWVGRDLTYQEIAFWENCGGVIIHDWITAHEITF